MVLVAEDVGEDADLLAFLDEAHRDAGDRRLHGHARLHERQRAAADARHRRRPVRLEDLGHDADRVGERRLVGQDRKERALRERTVADLATAGAAQELDLAGAVRWEVIVEHELPVVLADERVHLLLVGRRPERGGDERLRLDAREERRAMRPGKHLDLAADRPDVGEAAPVETLLLADDLLARRASSPCRQLLHLLRLVGVAPRRGWRWPRPGRRRAPRSASC